MHRLHFIIILFVAILPFNDAIAKSNYDKMEDVVYLRNGSIIRGLIVERVINTSLKIQTKDGSVFVYPINEVEKITIEPIIGIPPAVTTTPSLKDNTKNRLESWYTYWGGGYTNITYPDEVDQQLNILADLPGVDHFSLGIDLLGLYWPQQDEQTLLGGVVNGFSDRYEFDGEWFEINSYTYSASIIHFIQNRIGDGVFVRSDIGFARHVIDASGISSEASDWGIGVLFGGGVGLPVARGTRILLNVNYALKRIVGETTGNLGISIGGLF